jgi:hypothetical protein
MANLGFGAALVARWSISVLLMTTMAVKMKSLRTQTPKRQKIRRLMKISF